VAERVVWRARVVRLSPREAEALRALRVASRLSPDSWVEAWEIVPFLEITCHVTREPWHSDAVSAPARSTPRRFAGAYTAWRWPSALKTTAVLAHLKRKGLAESLPLLRATRTGNLAYVGRRAWRPRP
jgi:hypothetical protein